jgi:DNA repair photolyase
MVAPIIPGLNDSEIPAVLKAAAEAGAMSAGFTPLRLPLAVKPIFLDWLERTQPTARPRIEALIRSTRGGKHYVSEFGQRMRGTGDIAEQIERIFKVFAARYHLNGPLPAYNTAAFRPPLPKSGQMRLF